MTNTKEQERAIMSHSQVILCQAGPGSGKTKTLTHRVKRLLEEGDPDGVIVLTFTRDAAKEMRERLALMTKRKPGYIGTFHGLCWDLLLRYGQWIGYVLSKFNVLSEEEAKEIKAEIEKDLGLQSRAKRDPRDPHALIDLAFRARCADNNEVTYDLMQVEALRLLKSEAKPIREWIDGISNVLVDEAQDMDSEQFEFVKFFIGEGKDVFAVGDRNQSIYGWRRAVPGVLDSYGALADETIVLDKNFRSTDAIIAFANRYADPKQALNGSLADLPVTVLPCRDVYHEANVIAGLIKSTSASLFTSAIILRKHSQKEPLRAALQAAGVAFAECSTDTGTLSAEDEESLRGLKLFAHPDNDALARRTLPKLCGLRPDVLRREANSAMMNGRSIMEQLRTFSGIDPFAGLDTSTPWPAVLQKIGYSRSLMELCAGYPANWPVPALLEALEEDRYATQGSEEIIEGVTLITAHAAKGLEFDQVFIPGAVEGIWPNKQSDAEEEKRLWYVAGTRTRTALYITVPGEVLDFFKRPVVAAKTRFAEGVA